jgi:uncharacterized protein YraI
MCMKKKRFWVYLIVIGFILTGLQSCKKQAFFAPGDAEIQLIADATSIGLNESVGITIRGYNGDGSYLWDGTRIDLTIENGALDNTSIELEDGLAYVTATGNMEKGTMNISARSGSTTAQPDPLVITIGHQITVNRIITSLNPSTIPYSGGRIEIVVTIYDEYLDPIPDIKVVLESSAGTLESRGTPLITNTAGQVMDYLVTTEDATITIYAGNETHTVDIALGETPEPNQSPNALFSYSPDNPVSKETVYFNADASTDDDGDVVSFHWDFGDGTYKTGKRKNHAYEIFPFESKTFSVTLTVYDDDGAHNTITKTVTVTLK